MDGNSSLVVRLWALRIGSKGHSESLRQNRCPHKGQNGVARSAIPVA